MMALSYRPELGESASSFDEARCLELIRKGAGQPELEATVLDVRSWDAAAFVADRFAKGRVFLVGDAAHLMPPTGGFGGNTGIHDAHNLAWKIDAVLRGIAGPGLLDTYDQERRPVAERTLAQSLARLKAWFKDPLHQLPPTVPIVDDYAVIFGYVYPEGAFLSERDPDEVPAFENPRSPSGRPGTRAPHLVVGSEELPVSTIDLADGLWKLLAGHDADRWIEAMRRVRLARLLGVESYQIGPVGDLADVHGRWEEVFGVGAGGAVLIRPDGFVAWRARETSPDAEAILENVLARMSFTVRAA
jgi:hypothetical protein